MAETKPFEAGTKVYIIGGNNEDRIGANCKIIENTDIDGSVTRIMIDCGVMLPNDGMGYDAVFPDIRTFLDKKGLEKAEKPIDAYFQTHAHADHNDGLDNFYKINYEMPERYASRFTNMLTAKMLYKAGFKAEDFWGKLHSMEAYEAGTVKIGNLEVTPIPVSHSTAGSCGYYVKSEVGGKFDAGIIDLGDFHTREVFIGEGFNAEKFQSFVAENPVTHMFVDSTSLSSSKERGMSSAELAHNMAQAMRDQGNNRILVAVISRSVENQAIVWEAAREAGRSVFVRGDGQKDAYGAMLLSNYRQYEDVVYHGELDNFVKCTPAKEQVQMVSGAFADRHLGADGVERKSQLVTISQGIDKACPIDDTLSVLYPQREILQVDPKKNVAKTKNAFARGNARVVEVTCPNAKYETYDFGESGHIYPGELTEVLKMVVSKNPYVCIIPEHGDTAQRNDAELVIRRVTRNIEVCDNGGYKLTSDSVTPADDYDASKQKWIGIRQDVNDDGSLKNIYDLLGPHREFNSFLAEWNEPRRTKGGVTRDELEQKYGGKSQEEWAEALQKERMINPEGFKNLSRRDKKHLNSEKQQVKNDRRQKAFDREAAIREARGRKLGR